MDAEVESAALSEELDRRLMFQLGRPDAAVGHVICRDCEDFLMGPLDTPDGWEVVPTRCACGGVYRFYFRAYWDHAAKRRVGSDG
jgi:hypothetical protein